MFCTELGLFYDRGYGADPRKPLLRLKSTFKTFLRQVRLKVEGRTPPVCFRTPPCKFTGGDPRSLEGKIYRGVLKLTGGTPEIYGGGLPKITGGGLLC